MHITSIRHHSENVDTKKMIMKLRKETSLPLKNCREALVETVCHFFNFCHDKI